jgi:hypothetical protein
MPEIRPRPQLGKWPTLGLLHQARDILSPRVPKIADQPPQMTLYVWQTSGSTAKFDVRGIF